MMSLFLSRLVLVALLVMLGIYLLGSGRKQKIMYLNLFGLSSLFFSFKLLVILGIELVQPDFISEQFWLQVYEWIRIIAVTILLCAIGLLIREEKPKITRAPVALSLLPVLLLIAHPFVIHTLVLKEIMFSIYYGGAIFIMILILIIKIAKEPEFNKILLAMFPLVLAYILNFFSDASVTLVTILIILGVFILYRSTKQLDTI